MQSKQAITRRRDATNRVGAGMLGAVLAIALASAPAHAGKGGGGGASKPSRDCADVAKSQLAACQSSAQETFFLAIARCDNASEEDPKSVCPKTAAQDLKAERVDCADQLAARTDVCDQLGGGKYAPTIDPSNFSTNITNAYFPLKPGTKFVYEGDTAAGHEHDEVLVKHTTHKFLGVDCVEVRDTSWIDGALEEDTTDWYAQDAAGNVWYFGEEAKQYADGIQIGNDGSWQAGVDDALPGIVMEASPAAMDVYRQEYAISEAEDMADVVGLGKSENVPYTGPFNNALQTHEFSGLEPSASEQKYYVPNVGYVLSVDDETGERLELTEIHTGL